MRTYERTHPWLKFSVDLRHADYRLWIALGEVRAACASIAATPLLPATRDELHKFYLARGVQATTAIEGNTLSMEEVRQRIDGKLKLPRSREYLGREVDNVVAACNDLVSAVIRGERDLILTQDIKAYNQRLLGLVRE